MKYFKHFLSLIFLLLTVNIAHAKPMGRSTQPAIQTKAPLQPAPVQDAPKPITTSSTADKQQQRVAEPKTYADALSYIKTQMPAGEVLLNNNTFTPKFINFVKSLNLSDTETKALLEAGMNIHATWTGNNENDRKILLSLNDTIQTIAQAKPIIPTREAQPSKPLLQPSLPPRPTEQPKKAISTQPREQVVQEQTIKPIMPQQQLFAQKEQLQNLVKNVWENCLKALDNAFDDFLGKDDQYNIAIIQGSFEKLPKTDVDILFIKKTVKDIIAKTSTSSIKFDQRTKDTQEQALKSLLEGIVTNALIELVLQDASKPLSWCICHPEYKRLTLVLLLVNDIRERFPNKNQQIVYTSFASGSLLLDYVALSELLLSHTNILVNLIDLLYPDVPALTKKNLRAKSPRELHKIQMKNAQEQADIIDSFKTKIAQIISEKPATTNYNFDVNVYQNGYDYITYVQKNPQEKSNILLLVDPNVGTFGMADFPALANVINVWLEEEKAEGVEVFADVEEVVEAEPAFTIFLPRHHEAILYEKKEKNSPQIMQNLQNQLLSLIKTTGANKNYTISFINKLVENVIPNDGITDEFLAKIFPKLMETRSKLKENALKIGYVDSNLINPLTPIKLGDIPALLSWGTDAHISFQDLVWDALAPNAAVYEMYMIDPNSDKESNIQIIKVNPEAYKKTDVITPNSGAVMEDSVKVVIK